MLHLTSFLDELAKIAAFANAMMPPSMGASGSLRIPGPARVPNINEEGAIAANYKMHMPTVMADLQKQNLAAQAPGGTASGSSSTIAPGATPRTIPAPAGTLPQAHPTMQAPSPGRLGASMPKVPFKGPMASMPTMRPQGFVGGMGGALGKLTKPLAQVAAHA